MVGPPPAALVALVETWREAWEPKTYSVEVEELHETGEDKVAVVLRETGRGRGGGVERANRWGQAATVRNGKIVHTMVYRAPEDALEAARLRE